MAVAWLSGGWPDEVGKSGNLEFETGRTDAPFC